MKLATLRRRGDALPGVVGVARLDRRASRLATRLNPGDIAIIDQVDLDRVTALALAEARPAAVVNVQPSISGRYPNLGPELIVGRGIVLLDAVGGEVFAAVRDGARVRLDGDTLYAGERELVSGTRRSVEDVESLMRAAESGLASQLEAFAVDTGEFLSRERALLLERAGIPAVATPLRGKHVLVVVRGHDHERELRQLKHYIREYHAVLIGVDGGADALLEAGHKPHLIVGDMDAVSDTALTSGAEVVVRAHPDGRAPGLLRAQDLGVDATTFPTSAASEDAALLLAEAAGAELIVTVGTHADLVQFMDRGRAGMASSFLTRLRLGDRLVDAHAVRRLYRNRVTAAALLLLVVAALVAVVAALSVSGAGHAYLGSVGDGWHNLVSSVKDAFS